MRRREYHWSLYHSTEKNQLDHLRTDQVEAVFAAVPKSQLREWFIWKEGFDAWKPLEDFPQLVLSLRKADDRVFEPAPPPPGSQVGTLAGASEPGSERVKSAPARNARPLVSEDSGPTIHVFSQEDQTRVRPAAKPEAKQASKQALKPASKTEPKSSLATPKSEAKILKNPSPANDLADEGTQELSLMGASMPEDRSSMRFDKQMEIRIFIGDQVFKNRTTNISLKGMQLIDPLPDSLPRYFNVEIGKGNRAIPVVCSEVRSSGGAPSIRLKIESNEHASALLTLLLTGS